MAPSRQPTTCWSARAAADEIDANQPPPPRRPEVTRSLRCLVDLFRREEHDRLHARRAVALAVSAAAAALA